LGAVFVVFKPKNSFALFSALWAFGLIAAYSLVPYKTPWLVLNFIVPLTLIAGYAVQRIFELEQGQLRLPVIILIAAILIGGYQTVDLNFVNYDNDNQYYVYVYAHTRRETKQLVDEIDRIARQGPDDGRTGITIVSREYWPLPWYLRHYSRVGYYGRMTPTNEPIIIASDDQRAEMDATFGNLYTVVPSGAADEAFILRPGVKLLLYVRRTGPTPLAAAPENLKRQN
jgi:predicted membrane-bound mannosyltransferase